MKISFCTTCKNRGDHLRQTLPHNLALVGSAVDEGTAEFVIVDYDSQDGISDWLEDHYRHLIASGALRLVKVPDQPVFRHSHAKNIAHQSATGDVLVNVDADNYLSGDDLVPWLRVLFARTPGAIVVPRRMTFLGFLWERYGRKLSGAGRPDVGIMGRIAISRERFLVIGGYDEKIRGWGAEDIEFMLKARDRGGTPVFLPGRYWGGAIVHSDEERVRDAGGDMSRFRESAWTLIRSRWKQFRRRDR